MTFALTIVSTVGLGVVLGPEAIVGRAIRAFGRIPRVGPPLESLIVAVRMYNRKPRVLTLSSLMTVGVHSFFAVGCYLIACGLPGNHLSLAQHFVVMPLSAAMQVIPLPIGPTEVVLELPLRPRAGRGAAHHQGPRTGRGAGLPADHAVDCRVGRVLLLRQPPRDGRSDPRGGEE